MSFQSMSVRSEAITVTGPAKAGDPTTPETVLHAEGSCAEWRTLLVESDGPVDLILQWTVAATQFSATVTMARGGSVSLFATTVHVLATARTSGTLTVSVGIYDGRTDTQNVWIEPVTGPADATRLTSVAPPLARSVRLECGNSTASVELTLVDAYGNPRVMRAGGPGEVVEADLADCPNVLAYLPAGATGRLVYTLPF